MKILVTVLSCHKNWNLWNTIKKNIPKDLIIFSYSPKQENWYDEKERILYLNCRDTYECLPEKIICMIDQVLNNQKFDKYTHILKIDDYEAMNLTQDKINNLYNYKIIKNNNYIGQNKLYYTDESNCYYHYGKVSENSSWHNKKYRGSFVPWLNGGRSYILSKHAMKCIQFIYNSSNLDKVYKYEIYEDLMIAKLLYKFNIFPIELNYHI